MEQTTVKIHIGDYMDQQNMDTGENHSFVIKDVSTVGHYVFVEVAPIQSMPRQKALVAIAQMFADGKSMQMIFDWAKQFGFDVEYPVTSQLYEWVLSLPD